MDTIHRLIRMNFIDRQVNKKTFDLITGDRGNSSKQEKRDSF